jgi:hypothetical protein
MPLVPESSQDGENESCDYFVDSFIPQSESREETIGRNKKSSFDDGKSREAEAIENSNKKKKAVRISPLKLPTSPRNLSILFQIEHPSVFNGGYFQQILYLNYSYFFFLRKHAKEDLV